MTKIVSEGKTINLALQTADQIKTDQDGIRKTLLSLDQSIHSNAIQCLMHAEKHGDTSLMRRLLIDVIDAKTGYRRQGLINWMRKHSPMELKGDTINLTGVNDKGEKRPFLIEQAFNTPFWNDRDNAERVAKPVFQDTLLSPFARAIKDFDAAMENTVNGKPVDPSKPFYDGVHGDKMTDFFKQVRELQASLPADATREVRLTQKRIAEDTAFVKANASQVAALAVPAQQAA